MAKIEWDKQSEHYYETGVNHGVLYVQQTVDGEVSYKTGVAWNGLSSVSESPSGADANDIYADDMKYLTLRSEEEYGGSLEAYTYPDEFSECDGSKMFGDNGTIVVGQQTRKSFGLVYETTLGNDTVGNDYGTKLHIVWNATANPSQRQYQTINSSPEAITLSWEFTTIKVDSNFKYNDIDIKPFSHLEIDLTQFSDENKQWIRDELFGSDTKEPTLYPQHKFLKRLHEKLGDTVFSSSVSGEAAEASL